MNVNAIYQRIFHLQPHPLGSRHFVWTQFKLFYGNVIFLLLAQRCIYGRDRASCCYLLTAYLDYIVGCDCFKVWLFVSTYIHGDYDCTYY